MTDLTEGLRANYRAVKRAVLDQLNTTIRGDRVREVAIEPHLVEAARLYAGALEADGLVVSELPDGEGIRLRIESP